MKHKIKKNLYLIITSIVFGFSVIFSAVIFISLEVEGELNRTSVGFIYLGDKSPSQYNSILSLEVNRWANNANYTVYFQEYTYDIEMAYFTFDITKTLQLLRKNINNRAYFTLSTENQLLLEQDLRNQFTDLIIDEFDLESFVDDILRDLQVLFVKKEYQLETYLNEDISKTVIDVTQVTNVALDDVDYISEHIEEIIIPKNQRFSLLQTLSHLTLTNNQLSIIASGIQGVVDISSMSGFTYEQNRILPPWSTPGQNVRILQVNKYDFTFFNHLNYALSVSIEKIDDITLEFKLIGYPYVTNYQVVSVDLMVIPFATIIYQDSQIVDDPNVEIIDSETETLYRLKIQDGIDGLVVFYYREVTQLNEDTYSYRIYDEQYLPTPEIYYEYLVIKEGI